jgi:hypothetical protein
VFFVLDGMMSFFVRDEWVDAPAGSFVLVPGGVTHDFENRGDTRGGALNISAPGEFEARMPGIAIWFDEHPPSDAGCRAVRLLRLVVIGTGFARTLSRPAVVFSS